MTTPLEEAQQIRIQEASELCLQKKGGGIDYTAMTTVFDSGGYSANAIISYQIAGMVPVDFTVPDIDGNFVVVTLAQFLDLNTGIVDLHYLCQLNFTIISNAIELLTTVEEVEEYDINAGWPTVPHVI